MRMRNLFLVIVMAGLTFGGTFTCNSNDDDDDDFAATNASPSVGSVPFQSGAEVTDYIYIDPIQYENATNVSAP